MDHAWEIIGRNITRYGGIYKRTERERLKGKHPEEKCDKRMRQKWMNERDRQRYKERLNWN